MQGRSVCAQPAATAGGSAFGGEAPAQPQGEQGGETPDATSAEDVVNQVQQAFGGEGPEVQRLLQAAKDSGFELSPEQLKMFNDNKGLLPQP